MTNVRLSFASAFALMLGASFATCGAVAAEVFDVRDFGAVGDGAAKDTAAVQKAVDAASAAGGGEVLLPKGTYLCGSVFLKSGVDFHLAEGATLKGSPDPADYNAIDVCPQNGGGLGKGDNTSGGHLLLCIEQSNVTLRGPGKVDGNVRAFLKMPDGSHPSHKLKIPWRPSQMVWFVESKNIAIRDIELADAPYWSCFVHGCEDVVVDKAYIHTVRKPHTYNGDGLDIDCSRHVRVSGCRISTADDSITLRGDFKRLKRPGDCADVVVSNCTLSSDCNAIRLGVGNGRVRDCSFSDIRIENTRYAVNAVGAWSRPEHGVDISNVSFRNMTVDARAFCKFYYKHATHSVFDGITFNHVRGKVREPSIFDDKPARPFRNLRFDDVRIDGETSPRVSGAVRGAADRAFWVEKMIEIAAPVVTNLEAGTLRVNLPRRPEAVTDPYAELEAFGRTMVGFAPWFELPDDDTPEGRLRAAWRPRLLKAIRNAVDPKSPDFMVFASPKGRQPLVDAAFFAQGLLRARKGLWDKLDAETQRLVVDALVSSRATEPYQSNWLLFAGEVEAFLLEVTGKCDMARLRLGADKFAEEWYVGEGYYSDGKRMAFDGYNSFVIQPMFLEIAEVMARHAVEKGSKYVTLARRRLRRYADIQERLISPEGTYPMLGRSICYRFGTLQGLALAATRGPAWHPASDGAIRSAMTAVLRRQTNPRNFRPDGWLQIGFNGVQPELAERYIDYGSPYLCTAFFLPLSLPPDAPFWTAPEEPWTCKAGWDGGNVRIDHSFK